MFIPQKKIALPEVFYQEETGQPFVRCMICSCALLTSDEPYFVEKAYRAYPAFGARELVFEYAVCLSCYDGLWDTFSEASRQHLETYFEQRMDPFSRARELLEKEPDGPNRWLSHCMIKGTPADELEEYQILGLCVGDALVLSHLPCLLSGAVMEEIAALLSNETLDELGGWMREFLPQPPGLDEDVPIKRLLFI